MQDHGAFSGNPKTEWLTDVDGPDRDMRLLEDFCYIDPDHREWVAPKGATVNGASIPRALWAVVGSPYTDDYRRASIVHDVACESPSVDRKDADVMFYHACRAGGCEANRAAVLYAGVRIGAWASQTVPLDACMADEGTPGTERIRRPSAAAMSGKLTDISAEITDIGDDPSIEELDAVIARHLSL